MTTPVEKEIIQEANVAETVVPEVVDAVVPEEVASDAEASTTVRVTRSGGRGAIRGRSPRGGGRSRAPRERGEFEQVTIDARRVARVMAGGRRFNFSLVVVIGDKKGRVGVGLGKGVDTALAIDKATRDAKKHLVTVLRTASGSIPHQVRTKYSSSTVEIIPSKGRGLVAGSAVRTVLDLAGVTDVVTKIHSRSKNKLTIARATVEALEKLRAK
ncbi:30S ribosomal protein S5 [Candidatus Kaiserbacteria bacterium]|nr:30S ribosomal protein S5 [Candidatus Kaiserbacteria bacterium]